MEFMQYMVHQTGADGNGGPDLNFRIRGCVIHLLFQSVSYTHLDVYKRQVQGSTVNHQYSKSFKFEKDFHEYQNRYLPGSAGYFSMLRPLSEFQIARYFAKQKQYHPIFRSCNAGSRTDSWCGHCPKCLFVYLILSPFLSSQEVRDIFGRDMLQDEDMKETLEQLIGIREEKPFECVGSRAEINTAMVLTIQRMEEEGEMLPALLSYYKGCLLYTSGSWLTLRGHASTQPAIRLQP